MPLKFNSLQGGFDLVSHGSLLTDDHTQYALLAGRTGGQTLKGDTASGGNLTLQSTSHATKGKILFGTSAYDEVNNRLGIGTASPVQKLDIEKGHIRLGQVATPSTVPTVAVGAAGVLTGNYYYRTTFVTALGETETSGATALVAPSSQQVNLSAIPISSDSAVTARKIYRNIAGGSTTQMQLVTTINDNTTTIYSDNIADGSLGVFESRVNSTGGLIYNGTIRAGIIDNSTTAFGLNALRVNTGYYNTAMGKDSLYSNTTGYHNVAMGANTLKYNTTGYYNVAMGSSALNVNTTGYHNVAMGFQALEVNNSGYQNVALGSQALAKNTIGYYNGAMGFQALNSNTTGAYNLAIGASSLFSNIASSFNSAMGASTLYYNTGSYNLAMGWAALYPNTTGSYNIGIGAQAGRYQADGSTALQTANNSIYIGYNAKGFNNSDSNSIVIGYLAIGIGANSVVLGNDSIVTTALKGNVGIGTASPTSRIHGVTTLSAATGNEIAYQLNYTTNKATSGNDTGLLINMTDTASPGTSNLLDLQVGGVSKFSVSNVGAVSMVGALTTNGGLQTFGANDSGGAGFRMVVVPNV